MKLKLILLSAVIASCSVTLTGCATEDDSVDDTGSTTATIAQNSPYPSNSEEQQSVAKTEAEKEPITEGYPDIWDVLPYIDETPAEDFVYEFTIDYGGGMEITGYKGNSSQIRIPDTIEGEPVVSVNFDYNDIKCIFTEIILPDTVQNLTHNKTELEYINIPEDLPTNSIFYYKNTGSIDPPINLSAVYISKGVTVISEGTFHSCTGLTAIAIPDSVTEIRRVAFYGCTGLTAVIIPDSVVKIGEAAFGNCIKLTSITIPAGVTEIGEKAFGYYYDGEKGEKLDIEIRCPSGSAAEKYAIENGFSYTTI